MQEQLPRGENKQYVIQNFLSLDLYENIKEEENYFISPHPSLSSRRGLLRATSTFQHLTVT